MKEVIKIITAHSGSDFTKDNSMEFINLFKDIPVDCIEIDVRYNNEGLYLSHDAAKENDRPLLLDKVFETIKPLYNNLKINCDLKESNLERRVFNLAKDFQIQDKILLSGSVNLENLTVSEIQDKVFYNIENIVPAFYDLEQGKRESQIEKYIYQETYKDVGVININYLYCTKYFIDMMNKINKKISVWTINELNDIDRFLEEGIYNVTTKKALLYIKEKGIKL